MKKIRAQHVSIDIPREDSQPYATAIVQTVIKDAAYNTTQVIDRTHRTGRFVEQFATEVVEIVDPVTGGRIQASGLGVTLLIKAFVGQWLADDFNGVINELGDVIIEE